MKTLEIEIINDKLKREELIKHYEVLDKVKTLLLIPDTEFATTGLVADYYEVGKDAIQEIISIHNDELSEDGMMKLTGSKLREKLEVGKSPTSKKSVITTFHGGFEFNSVRLSNRGNTLFPRRAILRVGMLLRDSKVAKEVRTQLLNIEEKTSNDVKVQDINEEQSLALAMGMAMASGNIETIAFATGKMMAFKNRHIEKLQNDNKALANGILEWSDRNKLNAGVRMFASKAHYDFGSAWNELYTQLLYKYGIDLKARGASPFIQYIKENEWDKVIKSFSAICEEEDLSPSDMFRGR